MNRSVSSSNTSHNLTGRIQADSDCEYHLRVWFLFAHYFIHCYIVCPTLFYHFCCFVFCFVSNLHSCSMNDLPICYWTPWQVCGTSIQSVNLFYFIIIVFFITLEIILSNPLVVPYSNKWFFTCCKIVSFSGTHSLHRKGYGDPW